jgi:hypothetical protein
VPVSYRPLLIIAALIIGIVPGTAKRGTNSSMEDDKKTGRKDKRRVNYGSYSGGRFHPGDRLR